MRTLVLSLSLLLVATPIAHAQSAAVDPTALAILNRMSGNIGALHSCSFDLETMNDVLDAELGTLVKQHTAHEMALAGPDKMLVNSTGDRGHRGLWYDGKNVFYYFYGENNYGRMPAPRTIVATIDSLHRMFGIDFPAADFIYPTFVGDLIAQSERVAYLGTVEIGGKNCFHVAAMGKDQDVQVWIANDSANLPVKYVVRDKGGERPMEFEGTFSDWKMNPDLPATMFGFMPPPGAREVRMQPRDAKPSRARP